MESSKETGFQAQEGPILCINNCGFFGCATTMNMCSKCHKDAILKQEQAKLAASSIENIVNGNSSNNISEPTIAQKADAEVAAVELKSSDHPAQPSTYLELGPSSDVKPKEGPNRCNTCRKRVGLTGFSCKCGNMFCSVHRYSDKHECPYDYRTAGRDAIAKSNPVVKADKLDKI